MKQEIKSFAQATVTMVKELNNVIMGDDDAINHVAILIANCNEDQKANMIKLLDAAKAELTKEYKLEDLDAKAEPEKAETEDTKAVKKKAPATKKKAPAKKQ